MNNENYDCPEKGGAGKQVVYRFNNVSAYLAKMFLVPYSVRVLHSITFVLVIH
jgi:hypothetical protein